MKIDKTNVKTILTKGKLDILIQKPMPNDRLEKVRDVFAFCCFTVVALMHNILYVYEIQDKKSKLVTI